MDPGHTPITGRSHGKAETEVMVSGLATDQCWTLHISVAKSPLQRELSWMLYFSLCKNCIPSGKARGMEMVMLHFERWMKNFGVSEGKAHLLKKQTFFSQLLVYFISLLTWEKEAELSSI